MAEANPQKMRILIVRVGAMGDVLHGMPAVAALRMALPEAFIGWAVEPRWSPLLCAASPASGYAHAPLVDRVHLVEAKAWSKHPVSLATVRSVQTLRRALQDEHYDLAVDLQGTIRSSVIGRMSGAPVVTGSATPRERPARLLYTRRVPLHAPHVVQQAAEILSAAIGQSLQPAMPALPVEAEAERWCHALIGPDDRPFVFLAPTAGWGAKQWPVERFATCAVALSRAGLRVLVNRAGPNDAVARRLVDATEGHTEAADASVAQLVALLRRAALVIAGDTGPLHLAAALGVPTVALFGPTDPARNGPYGGPTRILRSTSSTTTYKRSAETEPGLAGIGVETVLQAAGELLGRPLAPGQRQPAQSVRE